MGYSSVIQAEILVCNFSERQICENEEWENEKIREIFRKT
uniref:Uncharacterized protein n=1 Tax=Faecalibaculum rodentium TaxID=1702221 RepID=A0A140DYZ7_9FIRM|nr:hypothetical protein AALO17_27400 [Faecalibaculum rodentium]